MKIRYLPLIIVLTAAFALTAQDDAFADASPFKSVARIDLVYDVPDTAGLLSCCVVFRNADGAEDTACGCNGAVCVAAFSRERVKMIRSVPDRFRLILTYSTGNVVTPELKENGMNSYHKLLIANGKAEDITPAFNTSYSNYGIAFAATLILELIVAGIFFLFNKVPGRYLWIIGLVNIISHPVLWLSSSYIDGFGTSLIWLEGIVTAAEGYAILKLLNGRLSLFKSFLLSIMMNAVSFVIGGIIYLIFS